MKVSIFAHGLLAMKSFSLLALIRRMQDVSIRSMMDDLFMIPMISLA
jgi:hypothetical protein